MRLRLEGGKKKKGGWRGKKRREGRSFGSFASFASLSLSRAQVREKKTEKGEKEREKRKRAALQKKRSRFFFSWLRRRLRSRVYFRPLTKAGATEALLFRFHSSFFSASFRRDASSVAPLGSASSPRPLFQNPLSLRCSIRIETFRGGTRRRREESRRASEEKDSQQTLVEKVTLQRRQLPSTLSRVAPTLPLAPRSRLPRESLRDALKSATM